MQIELDKKQVESIIELIGEEGNRLQDKAKALYIAVDNGIPIAAHCKPVLEGMFNDYEEYIRLEARLWKYLPDCEKKQRNTVINDNNLQTLKNYKKWLLDITYDERE